MDETSAETQSEANPPFDRGAFKAKWIAALRSGEYKQGRSFLRKEDNFCCLGVALDLLGVEWKKSPYTLNEGTVFRCGTDDGVLPFKYARQLGIAQSGQIEDYSALAAMNDAGKSFLEIADFIEQNWHPTND